MDNVVVDLLVNFILMEHYEAIKIRNLNIGSLYINLLLMICE